MNRLIALSIERRWLVVLLCIGAAMIGGWAITKVPIDAVPDITNNQVQINTLAPALSPLEVEKQVTFRIEASLAGIPGLTYTRSLSRNGFSQVTAIFSDDTNIYFARQQIGERLLELRATLPSRAEPKMGPVSTGLGEIYMWTVGYDVAPKSPQDGTAGMQSDGTYLTPEGHRLQTELERAAYLRTLQDWVIAPQLKGVAGVAGVDAIGGFVKQYVVQPDPAKLIAFGVSFADLVHALESNNVSRGAGIIEQNGEGLVVRATGRVESLEEISAITVLTRASVPVRIRDIAEVSIGAETRTGAGSELGREAVVGTALMLIGANSRTVAAAVDAKMQEIRRMLPPGIKITTVLNRTQLVDATIATVTANLAEGALLVIAVLFVLLGNLRAAVIATLVIPVTMLMTAAGMWQGRISANLMSLGALDFGLIVDGAVFIAENSLRRLAERQHALARPLALRERLTTVRGAAEEMIGPSVYGQAIIILVYVPLLTFSGVEGKMFEPMALTVIIALVAAFILSLTLVPALIAICISGPVREQENWLIRALKRLYTPLLNAAVRAPLLTIGGATVFFVMALLMFGQLGQAFIPTLDEKNIALHVVRIPSTSLAQSQSFQLAIEQTVRRLPEVAYVFSKTGTAEIASDPMPPNASDTFIVLKPEEQWPDPHKDKETLIADIERAVKVLPGNSYEFSQPIQMRFNELLAGVRTDIAVKVFGDDFDPMLRTAGQITNILRGLKGATDIKIEQIVGLPVLEIAADKMQIARRGLSLSAVQDVIGIAIGGRDAGDVFEGDRHFDIVVRLRDDVRSDITALQNVPVPLPPTASGQAAGSVPLGQLARFRLTEGPNQISRENGKRLVVVTANVRGRDIASVVREAQERAARIALPPGYWIGWGGQFENLAAARQHLMILVPGCFMLIFLLLYSALGSGRDALLVFSAVPLALTGGIVALWVRGMPFSVSAAVGFIALSGIAVLNGLVMLTLTRQLRATGHSKEEAIIQAALTRFRPIVMTALLASLGFVPMAIATSTGAEVQKPIATVVIGGLISATLLTLIVLPALYARFAGGAEALREETIGQSFRAAAE